MKERLINNLGLKILSVFLAFIIWLVVVNVSNPLVESRREIALEIENEQVLTAAKRAYDVGKSTVTVTFDVHARDSYRVQASDFRAYIDLSELYDVTGSVPVKVEVLKNDDIYYNVSSKPGVIRVSTEDMQTKLFELEADIQGKTAEGYAFASAHLFPEAVTVEGPMSQVGLINHVGVKIDIEGKNSDTKGHTGLLFYDANGNELSVDDRVHTNADETGIDYIVYVNRVKELSLDFEVTGNAAPGYSYSGVECSRRSVSVTGSKSGLASVNSVMIPASVLNVNGAVEDKIVMVDIREFLPEGVELAGTEDPVVEIRLRVEPMATRTLELIEADITMTGKDALMNYRLIPEKIVITVQGLDEDLAELTRRDLRASLDLAGLREGIHEGRLQIEENERFSVVSQDEFQIEVVSASSVIEQGSHSQESDENQDNIQGNAGQTPEAEEVGATHPAVEMGGISGPAAKENPEESGMTE